MKSRLQDAISWLYEYLVNNEDGASAASVRAAATAAGHRWRTVVAAKAELAHGDWSHRVVSRRCGGGHQQHWRWFLAYPLSLGDIFPVPDSVIEGLEDTV